MIYASGDKKNNSKGYNIREQCHKRWTPQIEYVFVAFSIIIGFILLLLVTYHIFEYGNPTSVTRPDWLSFLGAYLAAFASALLSMIALFQTKKYNEQENIRRARERHLSIQPIFFVEANSHAIQSEHRKHYLKENQKPDDPPPVIETFTSINFLIKNAGQFPILNVIIFDHYVKPCLEPGEVIKLWVSYDEPDDRDVLNILESEIEKINGYPGWFNINYEDADGKDMFKTFEYKEFDGVHYYTLTNTESV